MQGLKIQGLSPFYFSKVQLVSRLPLFANRSALALNKKHTSPKGLSLLSRAKIHKS